MQNVRNLGRWLALLALSLALSLITACSGEEEAVAPTPTPELAVVVFATEAPSPTPLPQPSPPPSPTPAATVGMGISDNVTDAQTEILSGADFEAYVANRPAEVNPLTGLKVDDPALLQRRPLMVRVGNDPVARPQVALNDADMVYEEITEWWVTRFTAIYLSQDPAMIAPVRSARLINLQLTPQYQGALASSGGSDGVRWALSQTDIVNLDEFFVPQPYFYRENEGWQTRLAFDATVARDYLAEEGLDRITPLRGFLFTDTINEDGLPEGVVSPAAEVMVPYPQATSRTTWRYHNASGRYLRFILDEPHLDFGGEQVSAANVLIYFADHQATDIVEDSNGATSIRIIINGRGAAWLLRDGQILKGNWETDGSSTPLLAFDDGTPMPLKPGNTWVQVVPLEYLITVDGVEYTSLPENQPTAAQDAAPPTDMPAPTPTFTPIGMRPIATPGSGE